MISSFVERKIFKKSISSPSKASRSRIESTIRIRKEKKDEELKRRRFLNAPNTFTNLIIRNNPTDSTADDDLSDGGNNIEPIVSMHVNGKKVRLNSTDETVAIVMSRLREAASHQSSNISNEMDIDGTINIVRDVRRLLSDKKDPPIPKLLAHGLLPYLTALIRIHRHPTILYEIIWCFINVASSSIPSHAEAVASSGVVLDIIKLLAHSDPGVCEHAIWFIANISGSSTKYRDALSTTTFVTDTLLHHVTHPANISVLSTAAWAISSLFEGQSSNIVPLAIQFVPPLVKSTSVGVKGQVPASELLDLMTALQSITECCTETCTLVLESGLLPILIDALYHYYDKPKTTMLLLPIVHMIWQFTAGTEQETEQVIHSGFLNCGGKLLLSNNVRLQKVVLLALTNIAAGSHNQIDKLLKKRSLMKEIVRLATAGPAMVKKQALWTMSNIVTRGSVKQANVMVCYECIAIFCNFLTSLHDIDIGLIVLEALETLLSHNKKLSLGYVDFFEHCNGIQTIEDLQSSENDEIYQKAVRIIVNFFGGVEDDESSCVDQNTAPAVSESNITFEFGINEHLAKQLFPENVEMSSDVESKPMPTYEGMMTNVS